MSNKKPLRRRTAKINHKVVSKLRGRKDIKDPYFIGQVLEVRAGESGNKWIPCMSQQASDTALNKIPDGTLLTYCGLKKLDIAGVVLLDFFINSTGEKSLEDMEERRILVGVGAIPYIKTIGVPISSRKIRKHTSKKKSKNGVKLRGKKRKPATIRSIRRKQRKKSKTPPEQPLEEE